MPQFDLNILNTQNVNIFSFTLSYLFYLKSLLFFIFFYFKYPYKLWINILLYILKKLHYLYNDISTNFLMLLPFLMKVRLFVYFLISEIDFVFNNS